MNEPKTIRAGDQYEWSESHIDYPAGDSWLLKYYLRGETSLDFSGVADGDAFDVTLTSAQTATLTPGIYTLQGRFEKGTEYHTPDGYTTTLEVLPNISTQLAGYDGKTHAQRMVDAIETTLESLAVQLTESVGVAGKQTIQKKMREQRIELNFWRAKVKQELGTENLKKGKRRSRVLGTF